jgi:hypothetical protein
MHSQLNNIHFFVDLFDLGVFQYGLLHFGQTFGSTSPLATHSCPHRSHRNPSSVILAMLISVLSIVYNNNCITDKYIYNTYLIVYYQ